MEQPFALVTNLARESRLLFILAIGLFVVLPIIAVVAWRVEAVLGFGSPAGPVIVGGLAVIGLAAVFALWFSGKHRYTLTVAPDAIRLVDEKGALVESLASRSAEIDLACHEYIGKASMRISVITVREGTHILTIGASSPKEPGGKIRRVAAPRYLIDWKEQDRLIAAVNAVRGTAR